MPASDVTQKAQGSWTVIDGPGAGRLLMRLGLLGFGLALALVIPCPAFALSEIQGEELPPPAVEDGVPPAEPFPVPFPDPSATPAIPREPAKEPPDSEEPDIDVTRPNVEPGAPAPEILYDLDRLPEPVQRMRELILEACLSGDIERLRPLIGSGETATHLSLGGFEGDPIEFLKELSGDGEGHEILAILAEVLEAGYVHLDVGTPAEMYVWPYFFAVPLDALTPPQRVELFRLVTAGDYEDMRTYGAYIFYRVGITPEGRWAFFVAGD
jgi:hypothetical protein